MSNELEKAMEALRSCAHGAPVEKALNDLADAWTRNARRLSHDPGADDYQFGVAHGLSYAAMAIRLALRGS